MTPAGPPRRVHQLLAALAYGDAISNEALAIQRHLRRAGFESDIFAEGVHPRMSGLARPLWQYGQVSSPETVCLFHFSIGSAAARLAFHAPDRLVSIYHNITPAEWFLGFHPHLAGLCYHGRRELAAFAPRTELALGDSEYNRRELEAAGYARTGVLPIVLDLDSYRRPSAPVLRRLYDDGRTNVLFVGRVIPNKRIDDLIRVFALYQKLFDRKSRLLLVGDYRGHEKYQQRLQEIAAAGQVEEVVFTGQLDDDDLRACYASADLFLCLSEHEGFCVPLLEAMAFGLPVVAYDAGAVRETLRGGGVLLREKDPSVVAGLVHRLLADQGLRARVLETQERAMAEVRGIDFGALLLDRLAPVLQAAQ
ncbi:MAG TPA: glycosyltransferase family 4 protein [Vicinamibacteria bacterium]|nr:glycosyltransferase family 4 protein [Vicinamibacteria bacterium]